MEKIKLEPDHHDFQIGKAYLNTRTDEPSYGLCIARNGNHFVLIYKMKHIGNWDEHVVLEKDIHKRFWVTIGKPLAEKMFPEYVEKLHYSPCFEVGKAYRHSSGKVIFITDSVFHPQYGQSLLVATITWEIDIVGTDEGCSENWVELSMEETQKLFRWDDE